MAAQIPVVSWSTLWRWKLAANRIDSSFVVVNPFFASSVLIRFGWPAYYRADEATDTGRVTFWIPVKRLDEFAAYVLQETKLELPPFPLPITWIVPSLYQTVYLKGKTVITDIERGIESVKFVTERALLLQEARSQFEVAKCYLALDFETYEADHRYVTEIGLAMLITKQDKHNIDTHHLIVQEYKHLRNGRFVPDYKDYYQYDCQMFVSDMLVRADALVFHDTQADMAILRDRLCVKLPDPDIPCYNTQVLYGAQEGSHKGEVWGLERMLQRLGLPSLYLHNAGNDAYATMEAFLRTVQPSVSSEQSQHLPQSRQTDTPSIAIAISFDEDDF